MACTDSRELNINYPSLFSYKIPTTTRLKVNTFFKAKNHVLKSYFVRCYTFHNVFFLILNVCFHIAKSEQTHMKNILTANNVHPV